MLNNASAISAAFWRASSNFWLWDDMAEVAIGIIAANAEKAVITNPIGFDANAAPKAFKAPLKENVDAVAAFSALANPRVLKVASTSDSATGSVKNFVSLVKNGSFLVRI